MGRETASRWIAALGFLAIASVGTALFLRDGSYFLDEASVVLSFTERGLFETFTGPLAGGGQDFPRFYLALIRGVRALLGPSTWATRLLPFLFFLAATALWMRLFVVRFRDRPLLVLLGVILTATISTWLIYGAMVKQYSLDVFLTLAVFSLPDRIFDEALGRGTRRRWIPALVLPVLFSYTYGVSLLARVLGWLLFDLRRRGRGGPDARSATLFLLGLAAAGSLLWLTDVRHTVGRSAALSVFWGQCILAQSPDQTLEILRRFVASWYLGPTEFVGPPRLPAALATVLVGALLLGAARTLRELSVAVVPPADAGREAWGSRSLGCTVGLVGVIGTSWVIDYPICAGRLTLYALCFQQLLTLEGLDWCASAAARVSRPRLGALLRASIVGALVVAIGYAATVAWGRARGVFQQAPVDDLRPALARVHEEPDRPLIVAPCLQRQLATLPEGTAGLDVTVLPFEGWEARVPRDASVWILDAPPVPGICRLISRKLEHMTRSREPMDGRPGEARLYRAETSSERELRIRRRRVLRELGRRKSEETSPPEAGPGS